jgi:hypothetical protein
VDCCLGRESITRQARSWSLGRLGSSQRRQRATLRCERGLVRGRALQGQISCAALLTPTGPSTSTCSLNLTNTLSPFACATAGSIQPVRQLHCEHTNLLGFALSGGSCVQGCPAFGGSQTEDTQWPDLFSAPAIPTGPQAVGAQLFLNMTTWRKQCLPGEVQALSAPSSAAPQLSYNGQPLLFTGSLTCIGYRAFFCDGGLCGLQQYHGAPCPHAFGTCGSGCGCHSVDYWGWFPNSLYWTLYGNPPTAIAEQASLSVCKHLPPCRCNQ